MLDAVPDADRRRALEPVLAASLEPGAVAAERARAAKPLRDLLSHELGRPRR